MASCYVMEYAEKPVVLNFVLNCQKNLVLRVLSGRNLVLIVLSGRSLVLKEWSDWSLFLSGKNLVLKQQSGWSFGNL